MSQTVYPAAAVSRCPVCTEEIEVDAPIVLVSIFKTGEQHVPAHSECVQ